MKENIPILRTHAEILRGKIKRCPRLPNISGEKRTHYIKRKKNPVRARTQSGKNLSNW